MFFKSFASAALLASSATAHLILERAPVNVTKLCGTPEPTESQLAAAQAMYVKEKEDRENGLFRALASISVNTYFHVVASSESLDDGYLTQTMIDDQLAVLNSDYAPHAISFNLVSTDWTVDANWATDGNELAMKQALRKGTYADLNVYFLGSLGDGLLGYCYFPDNVASGSTEFFQDGCTILGHSVPGGTAAPYNLGGTLVHEVGHWHGLYHTFQGGCSGSGDSVDDTPPQASSTSGCPASRDSCPGGGVDPIHNYMDYSDDICYEEFTAGQEDRMYTSWNSYRA
ncbi:Metalloprotease [Jackrogersella minutella]|nr:Metalloprotease [Jackrogersella minutella]